MNETGFNYIVSLIGEQPAMRLMQYWGGIRLHIPVNINHSHIIARRIGIQAATILADEFGGTQIPIPLGFSARIKARNADIKRRYNEGESAARIARDYGITERWVYEIVGKDDGEDDRQVALFK